MASSFYLEENQRTMGRRFSVTEREINTIRTMATKTQDMAVGTSVSKPYGRR
ncbi:hypothetical protein J4230_01900 [Candidatus Woesearchaeota archaeon]|nr:hypothetical protein [Candidatus Woesearchaeota archaeon]